MKDAEDEAFDEIARKQGHWGGGFQAKRAAAADKMQEPVSFPCCGYTDATAIKWNQFNGVVQCHMCGQVYTAAQPAQEPVANSFEEYCNTLPPLWNTHISRTYAEQFFRAGQAAQPAQERDFSCKVCGNKPNSDGELEHGKGCYTQDENGGGSEFISDAVTAPQPAQEPVAHLWECLGKWSAYLVTNGKQADCAPPSWLVEAIQNATAPPKREWVGLTEEDFSAINQSCFTKLQTATSAESILKERNI